MLIPCDIPYKILLRTEAFEGEGAVALGGRTVMLRILSRDVNEAWVNVNESELGSKRSSIQCLKL